MSGLRWRAQVTAQGTAPPRSLSRQHSASVPRCPPRRADRSPRVASETCAIELQKFPFSRLNCRYRVAIAPGAICRELPFTAIRSPVVRLCLRTINLGTLRDVFISRHELFSRLLMFCDNNAWCDAIVLNWFKPIGVSNHIKVYVMLQICETKYFCYLFIIHNKPMTCFLMRSEKRFVIQWLLFRKYFRYSINNCKTLVSVKQLHQIITRKKIHAGKHKSTIFSLGKKITDRNIKESIYMTDESTGYSVPTVLSTTQINYCTHWNPYTDNVFGQQYGAFWKDNLRVKKNV